MPDTLLALLVALVIVAATTVYLSLRRRNSAALTHRDEHAATQKDTMEGHQKQPKQKPKRNTKKHTATHKKTKTKPKKPPSSHPHYLRRFRGHQGNISLMAVSPNGEWIATTGNDRQLRISQTLVHSTVFFRANLDETIAALAWEADSRTVVCAMDHSKEVRFYRMRKKQNAENEKFPYELVELVKRRFSIVSNKMDNVASCIVDQACSTFSVVLTCGDASQNDKMKTTIAWDTKEGRALSSVSTLGEIRMDSGNLLCGRGASKEVKIYQIVRKKLKGEIEARFEKISAKSVMTLVASARVVNVVLCNDRAVVCCANGTIQVWNLNVDYRNKEDPKLLCSNEYNAGKDMIAVAASLDGNRIATATSDATLQVFTYSATPEPSLSFDFSIEGCHPDNVGDIQFCPSGDVLYSRGVFDKDINAWRMTDNEQ